jgi:hypothetical protein
MKKIARSTGLLAAAAGAFAVIAAPIAHADGADDAFLQTLAKSGITWPNGGDQSMVKVGHAVCTDWKNGFSFDQTLADAKSGLGVDDKTAAQIMGAATGVYCDQYESKFN